MLLRLPGSVLHLPCAASLLSMTFTALLFLALPLHCHVVFAIPCPTFFTLHCLCFAFSLPCLVIALLSWPFSVFHCFAFFALPCLSLALSLPRPASLPFPVLALPLPCPALPSPCRAFFAFFSPCLSFS